MRAKMRLSLYLCVILLAGAACSKKEANQTSQNPAAQNPASQNPGAQTAASGTPTSPQASAPPAQPTQPALQPEAAADSDGDASSRARADRHDSGGVSQ